MGMLRWSWKIDRGLVAA